MLNRLLIPIVLDNILLSLKVSKGKVPSLHFQFYEFYRMELQEKLKIVAFSDSINSICKSNISIILMTFY